VEEGRQRGSSRSGGGRTEREQQEWRRADRERARVYLEVRRQGGGLVAAGGRGGLLREVRVHARLAQLLLRRRTPAVHLRKQRRNDA
jgi:hypothetical protein